MNPLRPSLQDLSLDELRQWMTDHRFPAFHAAQLRRWAMERLAGGFDECTDLPRRLREALKEEMLFSSLETARLQESADGTVKRLARLRDGHTVESVLIHAPGRHTVCVSTQVGCAVRCVFCASGRRGLVRNLTAAEIVDQVLWASRRNGSRITNVVVMGMGEPLHNLDSLAQALRRLGDPEGFGLGSRHVTISTSGIVPGIHALADLGTPWNLALSLHATTDGQRSRLIPPPNRYPLEEIFAACRYHRQRTNRMLTLEYALVSGVNDAPRDAERLAAIAADLRAKVNLIPCNPGGAGACAAPPRQRCLDFLDRLLRKDVQATLRVRKGDDIAAACGQLRQRSPEAPEDPGDAR